MIVADRNSATHHMAYVINFERSSYKLVPPTRTRSSPIE